MANERNNKSKYWVFTGYEYGEADEQLLRDMVEGDAAIASYIVFGREVCPDTGRRHWQCYVEFSNRKRFNQVRDILPRNPHIERRRGSAKEADDYCKKDGDFECFGELSGGQGSRTDLESVKASVLEGRSKRYLVEEHFGEYVKYHKGIEAARSIIGATRDRNQAPEVIVYWGATGAGKTRKVYDDNAEVEVYSHPGGMWFDGFDGQPVALFDDFGGSEFKLTYLLKLLDRYPMKVPIKGSFVNWTPMKIYLTSNMDPDSWYSNANPEHQAALRRRFTQVIHFNGIN